MRVEFIDAGRIVMIGDKPIEEMAPADIEAFFQLLATGEIDFDFQRVD